ncbi:HupE/UreJ family protein [Methylomonas rhizoryzae]|uniref:HupE/UreJ family protein n=1 Tax=Methylomonas rhizoryzae TaxID=2608981 RepID=UPI001232186A|nr:HupE/UreJ family protein [Methylomonas rhizoryzae]
MQAKAAQPLGASTLRIVWLVLSIGLPALCAAGFVFLQSVGFDALGWHHGFEHPLTGWDHLVTMLAVGVWAAQLRGRAIWMLPAAFVGVMSLGGLAGAAGLSLPSAEGIILLSCAVFGLLICRRVRFSTHVNLAIVAFFAFFHGFAHGQEISASASLMSYTLGFMLATLLLHGTGILVAKLVVFSVTLLMTALFSNPVLAKHLPADSGDQALAYSFGINGPVPHYLNDLSARTDDHGASQRLKAIAPNAENLALTPQALDDGLASSGAPDAVSKTQGVPERSRAGFYRSLGSQPAAAAIRKEAGRQSEHACELQAYRFKYYFPEINFTPGIGLSSSGVGLTSPPIADTAVPLQPVVCTSPIVAGQAEKVIALFAIAALSHPDSPYPAPYFYGIGGFHKPGFNSLAAHRAFSRHRLIAPADFPARNSLNFAGGEFRLPAIHPSRPSDSVASTDISRRRQGTRSLAIFKID